MLVELPYLNTDEGVNFATGVEVYGKSQVPNNPTFLLPKNTSSYESPHSYFLLLLLHFGHTIIGVFPLCICCWFRVIRFLFLGRGGAVNFLSYNGDAERPGDCGSEVFIAEEADGLGDKESGNNTSVDVDTLLVAFMEDFHTWGLFIRCTIIRIFGGSAFRLMEFYLNGDFKMKNTTKHHCEI